MNTYYQKGSSAFYHIECTISLFLFRCNTHKEVNIARITFHLYNSNTSTFMLSS